MSFPPPNTEPAPEQPYAKVGKGCAYIIVGCGALVLIALTLWLILALFG